MGEEKKSALDNRPGELVGSSPAKILSFASYILVRKPRPGEDDVNRALSGLRKRAEYGDGLCCRLGVGTKKDDEMALHYLRLEADGGCQDAFDLLNEIEGGKKSAH